jgi:general secretion pathway protein H
MKKKSIGGFTLLELVVVLVIAGLFFSLGAPRVSALYDTMQYREAVRELVSAAKNARRQAFASGQPMDLLIDTDTNRYATSFHSQDIDKESFAQLPDALEIRVIYAAEVSPSPGLAAIRFYPTGGSSGGEIAVVRNTGTGVQLIIDWLLGEVRQEVI